MSEIAKTIGQRVRNYRIDKGLSQEKLAELSFLCDQLHYIGKAWIGIVCDGASKNYEKTQKPLRNYTFSGAV